MLSLHTSAMSAQNAISHSQNSLSISITRLGTAYRVNSAMDDAAGLQIATRLNAQSSGMAVAMRNTQNSVSILQTVEGALGETGNILIRMKDLAIQAANAATDQFPLQAEFDALSHELSNILGHTSFGGAKLLTNATTSEQAAAVNAANNAGAAAVNASTALAAANTAYAGARATDAGGSTPATRAALAAAAAALAAAQTSAVAANVASAAALAYSNAAAAARADGAFAATVHFQIGASGAETMALDLSPQLNAMHAALHGASAEYNCFGIDSTAIGTELTAAGAASLSIDSLGAAIDAVAALRSAFGAASNRLDYVHDKLAIIDHQTRAASGRIMDVDFAAESSNMSTCQMLLHTATSMLKQGNRIAALLITLLK
ncbi:flagellin [Oxalobacteraceae bacterium GrIS 1.11]